MIDHLLTFPDFEAALALLAKYRIETEAGPTLSAYATRGDIAWPITLYRAKIVVDENGEVITPAVVVPGLTVALALREFDETLTQLGVPYFIADREAANRGDDFVVATSYSPEQIAEIVAVEPTWAGSTYLFANT